MFFINRALVQTAQNTLRRNVRLYCNSEKQFKRSTENAQNDQSKENAKTHNEHNNDDDDEQSDSDGSKTYIENKLMHRGDFRRIVKKDRETFINMVHIFIEKDKHRRNHVEFINAALKHMKEFGVERDLSVYKELIDVMPKGKFIPVNVFQVEFMHYPKQQNCIIELLDQMEWNGVMADLEVEEMIANIFGRRSHPYYKLQRHLYWIPKFKYLSPWLLPNPVPDDAMELAKLAVRQMCTVDPESTIHVLDTCDVQESLDKTWIVSGQSPEQRKLLLNHPKNASLKIEGPFNIWLRDRTITYFTLIGDPEPDENFVEKEDIDDVKNLQLPKFMKFMSTKQSDIVVKKERSIHQQDDGTIYAICATGTSTKDSLLSWIRLLEKCGNPDLAHIPVLFQFRVPINDSALVVAEDLNKK